MPRSDLLVIAVVLGGIGLVWWCFQTAHENHQRNLEVSNLIAKKFFAEYEHGTTTWITTVVNLNATTIYTERDVESALRYLLSLYRVRLGTNAQNRPIWLAVDLKPQTDLEQ